MRIHDKAKLYDLIIKDYEKLVNEMNEFKMDLTNLKERKDIVDIREETSVGSGQYYAACTGAYSAMAFRLDIQLHPHINNLEQYKNQA
jgi:hypothetical protein